MKVTTEKPEPGVAALTVEVPAEEFDRAIDQAWRRVSGRVNIPGFRRGKAPRTLVERHVGPAAINEEALRRLLPERYDAAVEETGLAPIERPSFDIVQLEPGKPLVFKATVAVQPTVELQDYQQISVEPEQVEVGQEEIDRVLARLRESQAQWLPVEDRGLEMGDQAIADVDVAFPAEDDRPARTTERKDSEVVLGENGYPEGFDRELLGARPGETRTFSLTWGLGPTGSQAPAEPAEPDRSEDEPPADGDGEAKALAPAAGADEASTTDGQDAPVPPAPVTAGPTTTFTVTVKDVKRKQLPDLDDDFAKSLGEHDSFEALTTNVRARLGEEALRNARVAMENKVVDAAIERATFEVPERLIDAETDALAQDRSQTLANQGLTVERYLSLLGRSETEWRAELRQQAERQIKARVLLDTIAEREAVTEISAEEIAAEIERTADGYGQQADEVRRTLATPDSHRRIATSLRRHKAIEKLVEFAGGYPMVPEALQAAMSEGEAPDPQGMADGAEANAANDGPEATERAEAHTASDVTAGPVATVATETTSVPDGETTATGLSTATPPERAG